MPDAAAGKIEVRCTVNGQAVTLRAYPMARLLDVLREDLRLTGTKEGCGEGECGACSVLLDGALVNSCLVPAAHAAGAHIVTIEGVAACGVGDGELHAVQQAFLDHGGAQCGICTPGMVLAVIHLLETRAASAGGASSLGNAAAPPTEDEIREGLAGNLCRCTGYMKIFESVLAACARGVGNRGQSVGSERRFK